MGKRTKVSAIAAVVVALGLGAVGCGSDDPPPPPATTSTSTTAAPATSPPTTQDEEADEARAEDALLTADDAPGGPWVEGDARTSSDSSGLDCDAMAEESEYFNENAKDAPGAKAPELTDQANETSLQLDVNIVADDEVADTVAGFFADERFGGCLEERLLDQATAGTATITDAQVTELDLPMVGDSSVAWSISFTIEQGTETTEVDGVIAFVQVGRGFSNVSLISSSPVSTADVEAIMTAAAEKLDTALA